VKSPFLRGMKDGIPIMLGYLSVSFGFGILATNLGLSILAAVGISASNLTSAGQVAGVEIIAAAGTLVEMVLTQLVINIRYSLMGISLSQKLDSSFKTPQRMLVSFGITDEIFAVASSQKGKICAKYMYGLIFVSFIGWTSGTLLGAAAGNILPRALTDAMGIVLYGMFIAIIIPPSRSDRGVLCVVCLAAALSLVCKFALPMISGGFAIIICAVIAACVGALIFPVKDQEGER